MSHAHTGTSIGRAGAGRSGAARARSVRAAAAVARELPVVVAAGLVYGGVRELTEGSAETAVANAGRILELERGLGLAWEEPAQSLILRHPLLVDLANWTYIWGHWPVIAVIGIALFALRRDRYRLLRNAVLVSGLVGFVFFALVPAAPPRLADAGLVDTVTRWSDSYRTLQPPALTNQYAAMPSLHFGWNLLVALVLFGSTRLLLVRAFAVVMPAFMAFAVVATANHWVLDVVAGGAVVGVGLLVAVRLERGRRGEQRLRLPRPARLLYWTPWHREPERRSSWRTVRRTSSGGSGARRLSGSRSSRRTSVSSGAGSKSAT